MESNDYYLIDETTQFLAVDGNSFIGANQNPENNLFKISIPTDIQDHSSSINIFPNPSTGLINIKFPNKNPSNVTIKFINIQGEVLSTIYDDFNVESMFNHVFDLTGFSTGIYVLEITINEEKYYQELILEN